MLIAIREIDLGSADVVGMDQFMKESVFQGLMIEFLILADNDRGGLRGRIDRESTADSKVVVVRARTAFDPSRWNRAAEVMNAIREIVEGRGLVDYALHVLNTFLVTPLPH